MKAVILAAGEGQRLRPLTYTRPKHMIPIGGKPILEHIINALGTLDLEEILIVVNYKAEVIERYFGGGSRFGVKIRYVRQRETLGTADAILSVEGYVDEPFLAINGDLLTSANAIRSVVNTFVGKKMDAAIAAVRVERPEEFGVLKVDGGELLGIMEKPSSGAVSNLINAGIYMFSPEIFDYIRMTNISERGELEVTDSIQLMIERGKKISVVEVSREEWFDIGRPWDLLEANMRVLSTLKPKILGEVESGVHIKGSVFIGEGSVIRSGAYIEGPVFIGEESNIGPNCYIRPYTSMGRNVRVGNACEVKNSILMDNVHVGHLSYVGDCIIGEGCNLGAGFISANLRFDKKTVKMRVRGEKVDTGRVKMGVVMGDNVLTGVGAVFMPGVTIGCNSWIGPNVVVYEDVPPDTIVMLEQQVKIQKYKFNPIK